MVYVGLNTGCPERQCNGSIGFVTSDYAHLRGVSVGVYWVFGPLSIENPTYVVFRDNVKPLEEK